MSINRVYLTPTPHLLPFGDPNAALLVDNKPLGHWQDQAFAACGLQRIQEATPPYLLVPENCLISEGIIAQFLDGYSGGNAVLVLKTCRFGRNTVPVQRDVQEVENGWRFDRICIVVDEHSAYEPIEVDANEMTLDLPINSPYLEQEKIELGFPRDPVIQLDHWVHLLWANQMVGGMEAARTPKWRWGLRLILGVIKAFSFNKWKVLKAISTQGKGCDIHPTAVIEGSHLGNNVTVGPYARVLMSRVGDGAVIMAGAQVEFSTLGEKATVSEHSVVRFCLMYPESVASQYLLQQSVLGRRTVTTGGAFTMDLNFDNPIRVVRDGELLSTGQNFVGSAFGHRARIGTGFWLASGRTIPNDYLLIKSPEDTLSKIPIDLPVGEPLMVQGNTLVPISVLKSKSPS